MAKLLKEEEALEQFNFGTKMDWHERGIRYCRNAGLTEEKIRMDLKETVQR